MLFRKGYIPGAIKRKELKDYPQYRRYEFGEVFIDRIQGKELYRDLLVERWAKTGTEKYYNALREYFSVFERLDEKSDQEIYGDIHKLRKKHLGSSFFEILEKERVKSIEKAKKYIPKKDIKEALLDTIFYDTEERYRVYDTPISDWEEFQKRVIDSQTSLIIIPGHYLMLPYLFSFLNLLPQREKREIILFLKDESIFYEPTKKDLDYIDKEITPTIVEYHFDGAGIDLRGLSKDAKAYLENKRYTVIALGEIMTFSLHGAGFPYFIGTKIKEGLTRTYTNIQPDWEKGIPYALSYIEGDTLPAEGFLGMERVKKTLFHYEKTKGKGEEALLPYYFNFYSTTFDPERFPEFKIDSEKDMIDVLKKRDLVLSKIVGDPIAGRYIKTYYDLSTLEKRVYPIGAKSIQNGVLVTGLVIDDPKGVRIRPLLSEDLGYGKLSPRALMKMKKIEKGDRFFFNFLYFFTDKLIRYYNWIRKDRPDEMAGDKEFYIGYRYEPKKGLETFPLYNKGFVGYTGSGRVFFGRRRLEGGKIDINGVKISWEKGDVNPQKAKEVAIFTPFIENERLSKKDIDFMQFSYPVGEGRFNIAIVNDELISIRDGDLLLPCIGVVVSMDRESPLVNRLKEVLSLSKREGGYYSIERPYKIKITLWPPSDIPRKLWDDVEWVYGGGSLLVKDGINLVEDEERARESFEEEGWYHPLSKQTQETQVQRWVRGPRNVIGITKSGKFFVMTFSGRTRESRGVIFNEAITIIEKELSQDKIAYALNLDGGSSVCLGYFYKDEFFELNYPAPSPTTPAGMVRPVNSMVIIGERRF